MDIENMFNNLRKIRDEVNQETGLTGIDAREAMYGAIQDKADAGALYGITIDMILSEDEYKRDTEDRKYPAEI